MMRRLVTIAASLALAVAAIGAARLFVADLLWVSSPSMRPALLPGDLILAERLATRGGRLPARGDIVLVHAGAGAGRILVKRVIGVPGDRVGMADGAPVVNGRRVLRWRVADLLVPDTPATPCRPPAASRVRRAGGFCRIPRYRELLPDGPLVDVLDQGTTAGDRVPVRPVPPGRLFVLGDDRDMSLDSRGALGFVPAAAVVGRVRFVLLSTDGSARAGDPRTWRAALRPARFGLPLFESGGGSG